MQAQSILPVGQTAPEVLVGGKGLRLAQLQAMGARVAQGFVITAPAFAQTMESANAFAAIRDRIDSIDAQDEMALTAAAQVIAADIAAIPIPAGLTDEILAAYAALGQSLGEANPQVAVRSSAVGEDAKDASFAGQFETYLGVSGPEALFSMCARSGRAFFGARAILYRLRRGLDVATTPMAVVVLELIKARAAGVAFSLDPLTGKRDRIVIEGNFGFGESVVQGVVTPDRVVVDKEDSRVMTRAVADETVISVFDAGAGLVVEQPMPDAMRNQPVLTEAAAQAIAAAVRSVETAHSTKS
jgi:pyruvate, water dikinase